MSDAPLWTPSAAGRHATRMARFLEARRREEAGAIGLGLTASRKVGGAVIRNRARRRLREAARQLLELGWRVIGVGRDAGRCAAAEADLASPHFTMLRADLSSMAEAREHVKAVVGIGEAGPLVADVLYDRANLPLLDQFLSRGKEALVADSRAARAGSNCSWTIAGMP